jgi:hypothetical protein
LAAFLPFLAFFFDDFFAFFLAAFFAIEIHLILLKSTVKGSDTLPVAVDQEWYQGSVCHYIDHPKCFNTSLVNFQTFFHRFGLTGRLRARRAKGCGGLLRTARRQPKEDSR